MIDIITLLKDLKGYRQKQLEAVNIHDKLKIFNIIQAHERVILRELKAQGMNAGDIVAYIN